jgi:hypothetical protein
VQEEKQRKVPTYKLLRQRDLLKLHLVNSGCGGAKQRTGCENQGVLHLAIKATKCKYNV